MGYFHGMEIAVVSLGGFFPACGILCLSVLALGARGGWRRAAMLVSVLLVAVCIGVATKIAFYAWDVRFGLSDFHGASGHGLRAAAVYPTFAWIAFTGSSHRRCVAGVVVAALIASAVTLAAIFIGVHTSVEGFAGALIGAAVPILFARMGQLRPITDRLQSLLIACAIVLCAAAPTTRYDFEQRVVDISHRLQ